MLVATAALIVLFGGLTLALVLHGDDRLESQRATQPQPEGPEQSLAPPAPDPSAVAPAEDPARTVEDEPSSPVRRPVPAPVRTIRSHFHQLSVGGYQQAFDLLTDRYRQANPGWVALRSAADPTIHKLSVGSPIYMSGGAKVPVVFFARDLNRVRGSDTKCRRFEGTVVVFKRDDVWRYDPWVKPLKGTEQPSAACS